MLILLREFSLATLLASADELVLRLTVSLSLVLLFALSLCEISVDFLFASLALVLTLSLLLAFSLATLLVDTDLLSLSLMRDFSSGVLGCVLALLLALMLRLSFKLSLNDVDVLVDALLLSVVSFSSLVDFDFDAASLLEILVLSLSTVLCEDFLLSLSILESSCSKLRLAVSLACALA